MVGQVMRVSANRTLEAFGILVLTAGCTVDVVDPDSGEYQCETIRDCAEGYYCSEGGKCLADGTLTRPTRQTQAMPPMPVMLQMPLTPVILQMLPTERCFRGDRPYRCIGPDR